MTEEMATDFLMDNENPLVQYEIVFPEEQRLLVTGGGECRGAPNPFALPFGATSKATTGVTATLADDIRWEAHVDQADRLDYIVAVSSGVLAGLIDALYVGEFSLDRAEEWGKEKVEKVVMKVARAEGYSGDDLQGAIKKLEKNYPLAADGNTNDFGGGRQHHLRDFSHHFSLGGLFFSIFTQFSGLVVGTDTAGVLHVVPVPESHKAFLGKNFHEKIALGTIDWFFHMVSDMAGSSQVLSDGTGIPGPLVSFMKELSALPFFKDSGGADMGFRKWVSKLFNGTLLVDRDELGKVIKGTERRFDLRAEMGILGEIGRQTIPVIINQCIVRGFYFCRRLVQEIRDLEIGCINDLHLIAPEDILPWGTPAMRRMITVSSGVFTGIDVADAAVRSIRSKNPTTFFLRVNYVGVATFVVACVVDARATMADKALEEGGSPEEAFERSHSDLGCLELDFMQARILHSIEYSIVSYDIAAEEHPKRAERKRVWLREWSERVAEAAGLVWAADAGYFMDDDAIYEQIGKKADSSTDSSWLWLVAMEAMRFNPYIPLRGGNDKLYKGLKSESHYLNNVFCWQQKAVGRSDLAKLNKAVDKSRRALDGSFSKAIVGGVGVVTVAVASGGLAFYFAPAIAATLATAFGAEVATLHGVALTSASLAFCGGGAIAAGGAGMAGGTMLIAGGGAVLGAIGGSGVSVATSMALATNGSYVLDECSKLIAFCEEVLIGQYRDIASVAKIHAALNQRIVEFEVEIEAIKRGVSDAESSREFDGDKDNKEDISPRKMIKMLNRSLRYMRRSSDAIARAIESGRTN